jgi:hypothetical protein
MTKLLLQAVLTQAVLMHVGEWACCTSQDMLGMPE